MIYIDFDGVILDTEELLFEEWRKNPDRNLLPESEKIRYIQKADWDFIINNSRIINDAVYFLKEMDPKQTKILTKIHSFTSERNAKTRWKEVYGIKQDMIFVPYFKKKTDIVAAQDNVLVDDCLQNLRDWKNCSGIPVFFDMDNDGYDSWHQPNIEGYQKVLSLSHIPNRPR